LTERFIKLTAGGFGCGFLPIAPGTAGTVVGIPLFLLFSQFSWPLHLLSIVTFAFFAVYIAREAEGIFGKKDAQQIVIDEIAGFQFTLFMVAPNVWHIFYGFVLFRFFDIVKLYPARLLENRWPDGYGVVGDDVVAGIYGCIVLHIFIFIFKV